MFVLLHFVFCIFLSCSQFQPSYQTYYKKSFRVSDYGKDKLVDLLVDCPHLKLFSNMVYLQMALMDSNSNPLHAMSSPAPNISTSPITTTSSFSSPPEDSNICYGSFGFFSLYVRKRVKLFVCLIQGNMVIM